MPVSGAIKRSHFGRLCTCQFGPKGELRNTTPAPRVKRAAVASYVKGTNLKATGNTLRRRQQRAAEMKQSERRCIGNPNRAERLAQYCEQIQHRPGDPALCVGQLAPLRQCEHEQLALLELCPEWSPLASKSIGADVEYLPRPRPRAPQTGLIGAARNRR
jgi:hypothetical protein